MAWRMRRSIKVGPLRFTMTNKTLSASVGSPIGRVSLNTRGQLRTTNRIPGTGIYNTKVVNLNSAKRERGAAVVAGAAAGAVAAGDSSSHELAPGEFHTVSHTGTLGDFPPAGWYQDPLGGTHLRQWNGKHWQTEIKTPDATTPEAETSLTRFPPEGWYPDPDGASLETYWIHNQWTTAHRTPGDQTPMIGIAQPSNWLLRPNSKRWLILSAIFLASIKGLFDTGQKHGFWPAFGYTVFAYPGATLFIFGLVKGINGKPTWLNLPAGKQLGWILFAIGIGLLMVADWILPKP
jgi:hypothetical protein